MKRIAVFGDGGHAKVVKDIIKLSNAFEVAAVLATPEEEQRQSALLATLDGGVIAIGNNAQRKQVVDHVSARFPDFCFVTLVHPSAVVADDVVLGEGTVVMAGSVINPGTVIGAHCIVNTRAALDHDCHIDEFSSIAPGATLGGMVRVGAGCAIGLGANLIHNMEVGEHTIIGAGSTVVKSLPSFVVAYGSPARVVRSRQAHDRYL